jgi:hypothetical protein
VRPVAWGAACDRAAACDRGVRAAAASVGAARCVRPWCARVRKYGRTHQVRSNALWQLLLFKSFLALANHDSTQCPAQHKILKTLKMIKY